MLKLLLILTCLTISNALYKTIRASEVLIYDCQLPRQEHLNLDGPEKIAKESMENVFILNCNGVIDDKTFTEFPKLSKLTISYSNIEEISTILPIKDLTVDYSYFPNLYENLQQNLPQLQHLQLRGNKDFQVDPHILKNFKKLTSLLIRKTNFTQNCVTKEWFKGLDLLQELLLRGNDISCISEDALNSLKNLKKLDFSNNHISYFERTTFKKLTNLKELYIYENDLETIDLNILASQMNDLEYLGISWNTLKQSNISAEELLKAFPKLKWLYIDRINIPNDFKAKEFCQILRQNQVHCF